MLVSFDAISNSSRTIWCKGRRVLEIWRRQVVACLHLVDLIRAVSGGVGTSADEDLMQSQHLVAQIL
jgi:hypothetical protein